MKLILASSSPRRKELLEREGYKFTIIPSNIDETLDNNLTANDNVKLLAHEKALDIFKDYQEDIVLGCDTIVVLDNVIYGKPKDDKDAYRMLKLFSNKTHEVISGVSIITKDKEYNFSVISYVTFKDLTDEDIYSYIETKECFGKAGSYAIQGIGKRLIDNYSGELENIIGLPIKEINELFEELKWNLK